MSDYLEIDTTALNRSISQLQEDLGTLQNQFQEMLEGVSELDGMWEGRAKRAFTVQFQSDYERFGEYCSGLEDLIGSLEYASKEYLSCENKVRASIDAVKI
jgi:WXG100 family type VII secretion target